MTLPSKSGGFQLPKIETVSSHMSVESRDILYFDWTGTPENLHFLKVEPCLKYIKVETRDFTVALYSTRSTVPSEACSKKLKLKTPRTVTYRTRKRKVVFV